MTGRIFLGVDGGGTKTAFVVLDEDGTIRARHEEAGSYHVEIGVDGLHAVLNQGIAAVLAQAGVRADDLAQAFFGLPAYGEDSRITARLDAMPGALLGHHRYGCGNDMVCGWAGSLACADGINIVAGTGSIVYGECQGRTARAGGWGELFGDEGSAYWIAVRGLSCFSRMSDGRLPPGPLHRIVRAHFGVSDDLDISGILTGGARDAVAAVSRLVAAAADEGDAAAQGIFADAAAELAQMAAAAARTLGFAPAAAIPVSCSGGVFLAGPKILQPLDAALARHSAAFRLTPPRFDPAIGAALYAARLVDADAPGRIAARLR